MTAINCQQTRIETTHRILNGDLNEHGTLFGGRLLEAVDAEASVAAMRVARATLVTAAMDHVQFVKPFHLQDAMIVIAAVTGLGHRSVEVFVKVLGEHLMTGERFVGFTCFLTYVVPGAESGLAYDELIADNDETKYLLAGYQDRRAQRGAVRQQERDLLDHLSCK